MLLKEKLLDMQDEGHDLEGGVKAFDTETTVEAGIADDVLATGRFQCAICYDEFDLQPKEGQEPPDIKFLS